MSGRAPGARRGARCLGLWVAGALLLLAVPARALDPGDSNRDLRVSAPDFTALMRILAGEAPGNDGADANRDGFVLPDDVEATAHRLFGQPLTGPTPTATESPTPSASATATSSATPVASGTATQTPTPSLSPTAGPTSTATSFASPTRTPTATRTLSPSATVTGTLPTATDTPTSTVTPSRTSSFTPTRTPTRTLSPSATVTGTVPTATITPTFTASPSRTGTFTSTPTRTGTRTATVTPTVTRTRTPTATGTASMPSLRRCSDTLPVPLAIPDNSEAGASNTFVIADNVPITDLDVEVRIDHTFVGDLQVQLTHVNTGMSVILIDRDGGDPTCSDDNISATFDDEAARQVFSLCSSIADFAIGGGVSPFGGLGDFAGESLAGTWRLDVADLAAQDTGQLVSWCLRPNSTVPAITRLVCNDDSECTVALEEPFFVEFDFVDRDANATSFVVTARNQAGQEFPIASPPMFPPTGEDTFRLNLDEGFSCSNPPCGDTRFEFFVTVTDADGQTSPFASIAITSLGTP